MSRPENNSPIQKLRDAFQKYLHIPPEDLDMIDFVFAVFVSHRIPGDPLWGMVIDASGAGKTECLRTLESRPEAVFVSKLTPKSLKSGYRDPKHPDRDPSLLPKLHEKILVIKDLSPILSMQRDARNSIISDLRDAYDGFSADSYGNVGTVVYRSRFSLIAASTLAVERFGSVDQELGERFIKFRPSSNDNRAKVQRAAENTGENETNRIALRGAVSKFLESIPETIPARMSNEMREAITIVADFAATARTHVPRDRNHQLLYIPRAEVGTRLVNELMKLAFALAGIRGKAEPDGEELAMVCRVAEDCLPPNRRDVLAAIFGKSQSKLPDQTFRNTKDDLEVLGILGTDGRPTDHWEKSVRTVRKSLPYPTLPKPATSGVSAIFYRESAVERMTPPYTAGASSDLEEAGYGTEQNTVSDVSA